MRTPRKPQSPFRAPLNGILGTEANVRLLRVLAGTGGPVAAGELARRAQLGRTTIYPALEPLERSGIVEFMGIGAQRQAQLRRRHPLAQALGDLFSAEAKRVDNLISAIRGSFGGLSLQPAAAWLEGLEDASDPADGKLAVWIVADPKALSAITAGISDQVAKIQREFDAYIAVNGIGRSELEARAKTEMRRLADAVLLSGVPPTALLASTSERKSSATIKSHAKHDARARRLAIAIAAKLKWDPSLVGVALEHVRERMKRASPGERKELQEWSRILSTMAPAQIREFLVAGDELADRLRQSIPALGLLTPVERDAVLASATDGEARAAVLGR